MATDSAPHMAFRIASLKGICSREELESWEWDATTGKPSVFITGITSAQGRCAYFAGYRAPHHCYAPDRERPQLQPPGLNARMAPSRLFYDVMHQ